MHHAAKPDFSTHEWIREQPPSHHDICTKIIYRRLTPPWLHFVATIAPPPWDVGQRVGFTRDSNHDRPALDSPPGKQSEIYALLLFPRLVFWGFFWQNHRPQIQRSCGSDTKCETPHSIHYSIHEIKVQFQQLRVGRWNPDRGRRGGREVLVGTSLLQNHSMPLTKPHLCL
jgi:hypothetical protein